ncbi:pyridoxamine 5'-phosphate oxidase family protein [Streptomyces sp. NPDC001739]|uniref:Pyridoxamine 5'-phosphate oxidase family protein n=1 Tax=Streptomyces siderophoricus TaxID=2802281 RepID=A0ABS1MTJ7_9ACTN|nr:pyridoxamine 5'-phosphate oxidase family protein [Streptomyces sp. 9-7]MBL1091065.1 pyridoxamine 5'-phosphate oxidase family protein [Streptomyces sp. 9-7]
MATTPPARDAGQRKRDALARLRTDEDAWISSASADGTPYLVPLSFVWHDERLVMATKKNNPTARNLRANGACWVALGPTRDVVLMESTAETVASDALPDDMGKAFAEKLGWDPRGREAWVFLVFRPRRVLVWREVNELAGRELMRDGVWRV